MISPGMVKIVIDGGDRILGAIRFSISEGKMIGKPQQTGQDQKI